MKSRRWTFYRWACVNILWSHNHKIQAPNSREEQPNIECKRKEKETGKNFLIFSLSCYSNVSFFCAIFYNIKSFDKMFRHRTRIFSSYKRYTAIQMYLICILHNLHGICWPNPCIVVIFLSIFTILEFLSYNRFRISNLDCRIPFNLNKLIFMQWTRICGQLYVEIAKNQLINAVIITFNQLT